MAKTGRPVTTLPLTGEERAGLKARLAVRKAPADEKCRMRVMPACADAATPAEHAIHLNTDNYATHKTEKARLACRSATLPRPLHAILGVMAHADGAVLQADRRKVAKAPNAHAWANSNSPSANAATHTTPTQTVQLDQGRRYDPGFARSGCRQTNVNTVMRRHTGS